jgi:para-nitrobenzyl esterase
MIINTKYGQIDGWIENGCVIFKGVPYAKPPIGALRFQKPQKLEPWEGVYKADHFRFRSMQGPDRGGFYHKEFYSNPNFITEMSEDCLYLNIYIPEKKVEGKLPVAVYVHGGAFMGGAGSNLPFVCNELAKSGVIIITINYRLGAFGFLCHPLLGVAGENEAGGNYGLWDQLEAISWVKDNIEDFGGDKNNITVFGQSAGAMSLQTLAVANQAEGLFERMILQSGGGYKNPIAEYRTIERATETAEDLLEVFGIHDKEWMHSDTKRQQALDALYKTSSEDMMLAVGQVIAKAFEKRKGMPFVPVIDGELLTEDGNKLMEEGKYLRINYMLGANKNDITTEGQTDCSPETNLMHQGDVAFAKMVNTDTANKAYVYYFSRNLPGDESGAFHSAELWYVFGSLEYCWRAFESADYSLSKKMISYWSNFMKTGNPNDSGITNWQPCTVENPYFEVLDVE